MRPGVWIASLVFAGTMAGCSLPSEATSIPTTQPTATSEIPIVIAPSLRAATNTPAARPVYATGREQPVNCRFGPGTIYAVISRLEPGQSSRVEGRDYTGAWMYVHDPLNPGGFCWVSTIPVDIEGDSTTIPVVDPPYVTIKKLVVRVEPQRITVTCDNFPQYALFIAEVTADGPTLVNWRWELSTGETTEPAVLLFEEADTQTIQKSIVIQAPNDYWGRLHINTPNDIEDQANLVVNCAP